MAGPYFGGVGQGGGGLGGGGGGDLETQRKLRQRRLLLMAQQDVPGNMAAAELQTMQNVGNQQYGALGLPVPTGVNVPEGYQGALSPLTQMNIRRPDEYLQEQFAWDDLRADEQNDPWKGVKYPNDLNAWPAAGSSRTRMGTGGGSTGRSRDVAPLAAPGAGKASGSYDGQFVQITNPVTGEVMTVPKGQATATEDDFYAQKEDRESMMAERQGLKEYRDPNNPGQKEFLTPAEFKIRSTRDELRIKKEVELRYPKEVNEFEKMDPDDLIDVLIAPEKSATFGTDPVKTAAVVRSILTTKGFSPRAIDLLIESKKAKDAKSNIDYRDYLPGGKLYTGPGTAPPAAAPAASGRGAPILQNAIRNSNRVNP